MATAALCLTNKEIDADWMPVTPFDPLLAIRQKEAKHPRRILRRLARIELLPSEMIYIPRILGASLTHFSESLKVCALFSIAPLMAPPTLHRLLSSSATDPVSSSPFSLSLSLRLPWNLRTSSARVTRNGNCSVSQIMPSLLALYESSLRTHARCVFVHSRKHQYLILLLGQ